MPSIILNSLYTQATDALPDKIVELTGSGSNRRYFRLEGSKGTYIGVIGESVEENKAFIKLANRFADRGLPVPRVVAVTDRRNAYLQEYLGDTLLFDAIASGRSSGVFSDEVSLTYSIAAQMVSISIYAIRCLNFAGAP